MLTMKVNAKKYLNVRKAPNVESEVVYKLERGDVILVTEVVDGWAKVKDGWCMAKHLEVVAFTADATMEVIEEVAEEAAEDPGAAEDDAGRLEGMSVSDLRKLAEDSGIPLRRDMRKADIIAAIIDD